MRKIRAVGWGLVSAAAGLLGSGPSFPAYPRGGLGLAQDIATENPGLGIISGGLAIWHGLRARSRRAVGLGVAGLALGLRLVIRRQAANAAMAAAMREGLGIGWQGAIPAEMRRAFGQAHRADTWGLLRSLRRVRVRITRDVLFAAPDGVPLRLDVYEPARPGADRPAVVVVHGGAWFLGDQDDCAFGLHNRWLAGQGYVVFDARYRQAGRWPAPLADIKCAIRWVRANASRYGIDPARIAVMGRSAGAYLALMAAYTAGDPAFPAGCFDDIADGVAAVVASGAPTDLRLWPAARGSAVEQFLGGLPEEIPGAYAAASPVTHVRPGLPPTLLIHGQRDRTVPPVHTDLLANALRAAGVTAVALRIPWGRHAVDGLLVGLAGPMIQYDVDRFLAWVFHRSEGGA